MKLVKVAAATLNQTPLDWDGNAQRIVDALAAARAEGASIVCLPELCLTGYGCEDAFHSPGVARTALAMLAHVVPQTQGLVAAIGLPVQYEGALFNTACVACDGRILGFAAKQNLAGEGIHYEPRWFRPWPEGRRVEIDVGSQACPLGDLVFDLGGVKLGFEICEDAWVADRPGRRLAARGVDLILNPSASHFAFGKTRVRETFVLEGSRAFGVSYVLANPVGNEAGRAIYDGHSVIASGDRILAAGRRFSYADVRLTTAVVDIDATRMARVRSGGVRHVAPPAADECVAAPLNYPPIGPQATRAVTDAWESGPHVKEEEFARSVALGLFDYLRKSRSQGFVVSLSGGADSSAVACLARVMIELGVAELGIDRFKEKLAHAPRVASCRTVDDLARALLTCVYQSTRNSGETTRRAARAVAESIGAEFLELDVDGIVQDYIHLASRAIGRPLEWTTDDVPLQNIQARARAPGVWLLANLRGALLLATSNRSEAAVGYTTMDGDTCGGLSPIAGIDKAYLRRWLTWMETTGPAGLHPFPALAAVTAQAPTAELRPSSAGQTDEGDLMPYDLLDAIERAAIRDKQTPLEVWQRMQVEFPQHAPVQLAQWVERFFRLWCRNQWKRERYAPSFHLDDENLDPKTWCRFPILSGNFERELAELRAAARLA